MYAKQKAPRGKNKSLNGELPRVEPVPVRMDPEGQYAGDDEISLYDIWRVLDRYRFLLLGIVLLAATLSLLAGSLMTPTYRAEVLMAPVTSSDEGSGYLSPFKDFGNIAALAGVNLNRQDKKSESLATLKSRKFGERFIRDNGLDKVLFADRWDAKQQRWIVTGDEGAPTLQEAYAVFDKRVRHIREDRSTGLVTLSVEWKDPAIAAQWANELVSGINTTLRQQAVETSDKAIAYLKEQLARTSVVELQQVLHRLIEVEMKKIILANINEDYAFRVIDPATAPEEPFKPRVLLMVVLSTTLGLILGIILVLILNAVRREPGATGDVAGDA